MEPKTQAVKKQPQTLAERVFERSAKTIEDHVATQTEQRLASGQNPNEILSTLMQAMGVNTNPPPTSQDILAQSQQQIPIPGTMKGPFSALGDLVQGKGYNPMAPWTQPMGIDNAIKLADYDMGRNKNQMDTAKFPLELSKLATDSVKSQEELAKLQNPNRNAVLTPNEIFGKFEQAVQPFVVQRDAYGRIKSAGQDPSPAGDLAVLYGYMKLLDPGSTVREGEFATAQNSAGIPQRVAQTYNRILSGKRLATEQRADFLDRAERIFKSADSQYRRTRKEYSRLAIANKLDPEALIRDLSIADDEQGSTTTTTPNKTNASVTKTSSGNTFRKIS